MKHRFIVFLLVAAAALRFLYLLDYYAHGGLYWDTLLLDAGSTPAASTILGS